MDENVFWKHITYYYITISLYVKTFAGLLLKQPSLRVSRSHVVGLLWLGCSSDLTVLEQPGAARTSRGLAARGPAATFKRELLSVEAGAMGAW